MTATAKQATTVDDGMSADERAAYDEWRDAEAELVGKYQALQRATERQQRALSAMRRLAFADDGRCAVTVEPSLADVETPAAITDVCRDHYGQYRGNGKWQPPNRCDACPLRDPCLVRNRPENGRSMADLVDGKRTFIRDSLALLERTTTKGGER